MTPNEAITALRALLAPHPNAPTLPTPRDIAEAITTLATHTPTEATDLTHALEAIDLADCSPRMLLRRRALTARLRLDATDTEAHAQARDLLATTRLRRRLFDAMSEAIEADNAPRAHKLRDAMLAADQETTGWQEDALRALDGPERTRRR